MKSVKKLFFYLSITALVLISSALVSVFLFKDKIINQFVTEANKQLNTPVKIEKIDISVFERFPEIAIVFNKVYVEDSHPGIYPLLTADQISFSMNVLDMIKGDYAIKGLVIVNSETNLKINKAGKENFNIFKPTEKGSGKVKFNLREVLLSKSKVMYKDDRSQLHHQFSSDKLITSIGIDGDKYSINANGDITTNQIGINHSIFLKGKEFQVNAQIIYDDAIKTVDIKSSTLALNQSGFMVLGNYSFKDNNLIDLKVDGKDTNLQTILSLFSDDEISHLKKYNSDGEVYFNLTLKGEIGERKSPKLTVAFGCKEATLYHPDFKTKITQANLTGKFTTPTLNNFSLAELQLHKVSGNMNNHVFRGNLLLRNFEDPYVEVEFKGDLDAAALNNFYPLDGIKNLNGFLSADFSFEGKTSLLKKKATVQQVKTSGSIVMSQVNFAYGQKQTQFKNINGALQFNNQDLALSNVTGQLLNSDFQLNGFFKNIITFLLFENQPIGIETDLKSEYLDVDQLFDFAFGDNESDNYKFAISPNVQLNFSCDVENLKYKRFKASKVKGDLLVKNQVAVSRNIEMDALGGSMLFNGIVDAKNSKAIDVVSTFKVSDVHMDSVFYVFENFYQDFIQDKHLKGQASADVEMEMTLNEELHLIPQTLIADISAKIRKGELNNFEPLKALNKYLDDDGLSKLRFADLKNDIHIENKVIYIPQMEIKSNVTTIQLSGTHTFDQHIDYRVVAPIRNKNKIDPDEAFGAIEETAGGKTKVFLKITGTTDNYQVSLDKDAVKKKIASDLKKEVKELKEAFRQKGVKKKKELELSEEEFDWEN